MKGGYARCDVFGFLGFSSVMQAMEVENDLGLWYARWKWPKGMMNMWKCKWRFGLLTKGYDNYPKVEKM